MSRKGLSKQVQIKLAELRAQLEKADEKGSEIDHQLSSTASDINKEDEQMLSTVLSDALNGVDITTRYPNFFQKLLANEDMRKAFLEDLDILVKSKTGELEPLPGRPSRDLDFLHTVPPTHTIELTPTGKWRITWIQVTEQLQHLFLSPTLSSEATYRNDVNHLEEIPFKLFHSNVDLNGESVTALLEALQPITNPDVLQLSLTIALSSDQDEENFLQKLIARLQWGAYNESARVSRKGKAIFPDLPLSEILDQGRAQISSNLRLMLESSN
jgi:hypothetical protein